MKKLLLAIGAAVLLLAIGAAVAFLAGSRGGRGPYTKLQSKARALARRPDVRKVVEDASDAVQEKLHDVQTDVRKVVDDASDAVQEKLHDVQSAAAEKIRHIEAS